MRAGPEGPARRRCATTAAGPRACAFAYRLCSMAQLVADVSRTCRQAPVRPVLQGRRGAG